MIDLRMHFSCHTYFFFLEKKTLNEMKEEIDKLKKSIKSRDQIICNAADKSQDEAK